jgi:succinyl-CoA:acetate CoA-transferase
MNKRFATQRIDSSPVRDAADAAALIPEDGTVAISGFGSVGYPKAVPKALATSNRDLSLTVISGGSVGDEIDTMLMETGAIERRYPFQATDAAREAINDAEVAFHDSHVQQLSDEVEHGPIDVDVAVVEAIAVGKGWFIPSLAVGPTPAYVAAADELIVEVNEDVPLALQRVHDIYRLDPPSQRGPIPMTTPGERVGTPQIDFDRRKLSAIVRSEGRDSAYTFREPTSDDTAIAENLVEFVSTVADQNSIFDDTIQLQFGVGSLGNALMSALGPLCETGREVNYFGEVIQDGLLDLLDSGQIGVASATTLALSQEGQDRFMENIDRYAEDIILRPADISNNPALIDRFGVIAVNSALEVDIYGNVNSTHVNGSRLINGIGGSGDFNRNALLSITALPSTAGGGDLSCIVPMVSHVDHTEHDVDAVITEQGVSDLRRCSPRERASALVENCAHPKFRPDLRRYIENSDGKGGHEPHTLQRAFSWSDE